VLAGIAAGLVITVVVADVRAHAYDVGGQVLVELVAGPDQAVPHGSFGEARARVARGGVVIFVVVGVRVVCHCLKF
jgi:hypothetical protein